MAVATAILGPALAEDLGGDDRAVAGVRSMDQDFGRLRWDEVRPAAKEAFETYARRPLILRSGGEALSLAPAEAGVSLDLDATAGKIMSAQEQDTWLDRLGRFFGRPPIIVVAPVVHVDQTQLTSALARLAREFDRPAHSAELQITPGGAKLLPAAPGRYLDVKPTSARVELRIRTMSSDDVEAVVQPLPPSVEDNDLSKVAEAARQVLAEPVVLRYGDRSWTLQNDDLAPLLAVDVGSSVEKEGFALAWKDNGVRQVVARIAREVDVPAQDARVEWHGEAFRAVGAVDEVKVDVAKTAAALERAGSAEIRDVPLVVTKAPPAITTAAWQRAVQEANLATASELKLTLQDKSWSIKPKELASAITFDRTRLTAGANTARLTELVRDLAEQIDRPARLPRYKVQDGTVAVLAPGEDGATVDVAATVRVVSRTLFTRERIVAVSLVPAAPVAAMLVPDKTSFRDLIMEAATSYAGSVPPRKHNLELAAERLNGTLVAPGATFSFNQSLGPTTLPAGFQVGYGIAMEGGRAVTVPSVGGGICQVATTLFHAVFWSGLPIVEREAHLYWISRYGTPPRGMLGLDATVDDPWVDFKFKNTTSDWLLIEASTDGSSLRFGLRGIKPDWEVKIDLPQISRVVPAPPGVVFQDDPTLPAGTRLEVEHAEIGFTSRVHRIVARGAEVLDDSEVVSNYLTARTVVLVGTGP